MTQSSCLLWCLTQPWSCTETKLWFPSLILCKHNWARCHPYHSRWFNNFNISSTSNIVHSPVLGPARHRGCPQLQLSHTGTAAHPTITDAQCHQKHSIDTSGLDYANVLLSSTTSGNLNRLQVAQNSLARVVCQASHSASATELWWQLH